MAYNVPRTILKNVHPQIYTVCKECKWYALMSLSVTCSRLTFAYKCAVFLIILTLVSDITALPCDKLPKFYRQRTSHSKVLDRICCCLCKNISACQFTLHLQLKSTNTEFIIMPKTLNAICRQSIALTGLHNFMRLSSPANPPKLHPQSCNYHKSRSSF